MTISLLAVSRLPVGSSANRIFGSWMKARARATLAVSPPGKLGGEMRARSAKPVRFRSFEALLRAWG